MATRSSLELMLDKLQQVEDQPEDSPPALPVRPISRARLPRARRPLQLNGTKRTKKEEERNGLQQAQTELSSQHLKKLSEERDVVKIQKCYRGHKVRCYYKELTRATAVLQSFIRGENARKCYGHNRSATLWAIIIIQKQTRNYFKYRLLQDHQSALLTQLQSDQTQVPYSDLIDLQKQVLGSEAKVRGKNEENLALRRQLEEIQKKWRSYEERMRSMEKEWQDEFAYIQECLVAANNNHNQSRDTITIQINSVYQQQVDHGEMANGEESHLTEVRHQQSWLKLHPHDELRKLKHRFKAWKKEYKHKLRDARSSLKKLGDSQGEKRQRHWWGRLSH